MRMYNKRVVGIFDSSINEYNLGNQIIMDAVNKELEELFGGGFFFRFPFKNWGWKTRKFINKCDLSFIGGTNSLRGHLGRFSQFDFGLFNSLFVRDIICLGVGWWQYEKTIDRYSGLVLKRMLSSRYLHAVRDEYTKQKLAQIGIQSLNTSCPTLWDVQNFTYPKKSDKVLFTITDYHKNPSRDKAFLDFLTKNYETLYFWPQGLGDYLYLQNLTTDEQFRTIKILGADTQSFTSCLKNQDVDYVGTRLHAGIRALQLQKRAFILIIDNRAAEMKKDVAIPAFEPEEIFGTNLVHSAYDLGVQLDQQAISQWKSQFISGDYQAGISSAETGPAQAAP